MTQQTLIRPSVPLAEIPRKASLGKALEYCAELAGYAYDKQLEDALRKHGCPIDKTQLSRWQSGGEGIKWDRFSALMDVCGNEAPLLWMLNARGFDLYSLRRQETVTERELRVERELRIKAEERVKYFEEVMTGRRAAA
jgi:hypothetical protein